MRRTVALLWLCLCLTPRPVAAVQPDEMLADPKLEARARSLSEELRCLVCQNQSIDDSAAPLARDLRLLVRERLRAGDDDKAVKAYLVARYGDFVLLKPPFNTETLLLWLATPAVLLAGAAAILLGRRQAGSRIPPPLDASEQARIDSLVRASQLEP